MSNQTQTNTQQIITHLRAKYQERLCLIYLDIVLIMVKRGKKLQKKYMQYEFEVRNRVKKTFNFFCRILLSARRTNAKK